jgi:hypothetical protein
MDDDNNDDDERQSSTRLDSLGRPTDAFTCSGMLPFAEQFNVDRLPYIITLVGTPGPDDGLVKHSSFVTTGK